MGWVFVLVQSLDGVFALTETETKTATKTNSCADRVTMDVLDRTKSHLTETEELGTMPNNVSSRMSYSKCSMNTPHTIM